MNIEFEKPQGCNAVALSYPSAGIMNGPGRIAIPGTTIHLLCGDRNVVLETGHSGDQPDRHADKAAQAVMGLCVQCPNFGKSARPVHP